MRDVRIGHEKIVAADAGHALIVGSAAIHCAELAKHVVIPNLKTRALTAVLFVLRVAANGSKLEDAITHADPRRPGDDRVRPDTAPRTNDDVRLNNGERRNRHSGAELGLRRNDRVRVNHRVFPQIKARARAATHLLASGATIISACATSSSPTSAMVEKRQMPLKLRSSCAVRISWSPGSTGFRKRALSIPTK